MPYIHCPACLLTTFSAARFSTRDECPRCGVVLPPPREALPTTAARAE